MSRTEAQYETPKKKTSEKNNSAHDGSIKTESDMIERVISSSGKTESDIAERLITSSAGTDFERKQASHSFESNSQSERIQKIDDSGSSSISGSGTKSP